LASADARHLTHLSPYASLNALCLERIAFKKVGLFAFLRPLWVT